MSDLPRIDITGLKGSVNFDIKRPNIFYCLGGRGSGKSALLEAIASKYLDLGAKVLDLFGSRDGEGLGWLRSPYAENKKICLIRGPLVEIKSHESKPGIKFKYSDFDQADIFISASPLYGNLDEEFDAVNHLISLLWRRHFWKVPIFILVREAANLIYSRVKLRKNQEYGRAEFIYLLRESRHCGLGLGLDSLKFTSIDSDVRNLVDYLIFKNCGLNGLPDDLRWCYRYLDPIQLRRYKPAEFAVLDRHGNLSLGLFTLPAWHKLEHENILEVTGITPNYLSFSEGVDQDRDLILEAITALPPTSDPGDISEWVRNTRGLEITPINVGRELRNIGYYTDMRMVEGKPKRVILKLP